jgi:hypothetical protein
MDLYKALMAAVDGKVTEDMFTDRSGKNPTQDDLVDQDDGEPALNPSLLLAINALENPNKAKQYIAKGEIYQRNMLLSLKNLVAQASTMFKQIQQAKTVAPVGESSMGVGGPGVDTGSADAGTGIPVKKPLNAKKMKKNIGDRLKLGSPANAGMIGTNIAMPGRSAFAKGIE